MRLFHFCLYKIARIWKAQFDALTNPVEPVLSDHDMDEDNSDNDDFDSPGMVKNQRLVVMFLKAVLTLSLLNLYSSSSRWTWTICAILTKLVFLRLQHLSPSHEEQCRRWTTMKCQLQKAWVLERASIQTLPISNSSFVVLSSSRMANGCGSQRP